MNLLENLPRLPFSKAADKPYIRSKVVFTGVAASESMAQRNHVCGDGSRAFRGRDRNPVIHANRPFKPFLIATGGTGVVKVGAAKALLVGCEGGRQCQFAGAAIRLGKKCREWVEAVLHAALSIQTLSISCAMQFTFVPSVPFVGFPICPVAFSRLLRVGESPCFAQGVRPDLIGLFVGAVVFDNFRVALAVGSRIGIMMLAGAFAPCTASLKRLVRHVQFPLLALWKNARSNLIGCQAFGSEPSYVLNISL